jgi:hypothetical protein
MTKTSNASLNSGVMKGKDANRPANGKVQEEPLWASEMAHTFVCEQRAVFERRFGKRWGRAELKRIEEGNEAHQRMHRQAVHMERRVDSSIGKRRCFIASAVYGVNAKETSELRQFRDQGLRASRPGRWLIRIYDRVSPAVAKSVEGTPWLASCTRLVLNLIVMLLRALRR